MVRVLTPVLLIAMCLLALACFGLAADILVMWPVPDGTGGPQDIQPWIAAVPVVAFGVLASIAAWLIKDMLDIPERVDRAD